MKEVLTSEQAIPRGQWIVTCKRKPPDNLSVLFYRRGDESWYHGWFDARRNQWNAGCEGFLAEMPDFWMLPELPE